jgi:hypothetical protein
VKQVTGIVLLAGAVCIAPAFAETPESHYSLLDNMQEKLSQEKLAGRVILGKPESKYVPIVEGGEFLLEYVAKNPQYKKDHIWGRLAHTHPLSTISYREEEDPSTHVVFRRLGDGSLKADIHLDGHGPQRVFPHMDEFLFHKLTFQNNNQDVMHANLERALARQGKDPKEEFQTRRERTLEYVHASFGLQPLTKAISNAMFRHYTHEWIWRTDRHYEGIAARVQGSLMRYTMRNTMEFGVANWRQEDTRYRVSGEQGLGRRLRAALVSAYVVPTPTGREFAYGRYAGIVGSSAAIGAWHPWRQHAMHPNYARQATFGMVVDPLARSLWAEFGPDLKRRLFPVKARAGAFRASSNAFRASE